MKNQTTLKSIFNFKSIRAYVNSVKLSSILILVFMGNISSASNYYWVGGSGNWSDYANHWATTSGGVIFHAIVPSFSDDVFFDVNSFTTTGQTVEADLTLIYCNNFNASGVLFTPTFHDLNGNQSLNIYGSLILDKNLIFNINWLLFKSTSSGNIIATSGANMGTNTFTFDGINGEWTAIDSLIAPDAYFVVRNGTFNSNNQYMRINQFQGDQSINAIVNLGTSTIECYNFYCPDSIGIALSASQTTFICSGGFTCIPNRSYFDIQANNITGSHDTLHNVILTGISTFPGNCVVQNLTCYGPTSIGGYNEIHHAIFNDNVSLGWNTYDSLFFNNPGRTVTVTGIQTINNYLGTNAQAGFPILIQSPVPGSQGAFSIATGDTVCLEYLFIKDMNAMGGGVFYAGQYSSDMGNNTGWIWSSCTPDTSNVWPGDANYDLIVDNNDFLPIGLAYGYTGPVRTNASTNFVAQPGADWLQQFWNGANLKHADCDGNGTVNTADTIAITLNYGQTHPFKPVPIQPTVNTGWPLFFKLPSGALVPGTTVSIPIYLGNASSNVNNFYGIAFKINYDTSLVKSGSAKIIFGNFWVGNSSNSIRNYKDNYTDGRIDGVIVRTDHANVAGNGRIATLKFDVANNASGILNLTFNDVNLIDLVGNIIPVTNVSGAIYTSINEAPSLSSMISIYPNPATTLVTIDDANNIIKQINLSDVTGRIVFKQNTQPTISNNKFELSVSDFTNGIYFLRIETSKGVLNEKLVIKR